ncbi:MAG: hypothetical protein M1832_001201 [Thelocarpon impressellum]|nr:MAG: hypothetical protein M1832_001201 [Thelocarpon impressellum]
MMQAQTAQSALQHLRACLEQWPLARAASHGCSGSLYVSPVRSEGLSARRTAREGFVRHARYLHGSPWLGDEKKSSSAQRASDLNQQGEDFQVKEVNDRISEEKEKKSRTPWHREGKLLTTPSRLLKLILPLTTVDENSDRKDIEPLALLVHPQQPLSYLERLIQAEIPRLRNSKGEEKLPAVHFKAEDSTQDEDSLLPKDGKADDDDHGRAVEAADVDEGDRAASKKHALRGGPGEGGVESYSGLGHEKSSGEDDPGRKFVRWSSSTEIGDFIRDAARGKEFAVEIEGAPEDIHVGVPSFNDRTYYLRNRLRKTSKSIADLNTVKLECDEIAHKRGQRVALSGLGLLAGWWYVVYRLTFETDLGWDVMEPVTYLVGLTTIIGGYGWFLYHNREVSYRSALNLTISRSQTKLYQTKGFDVAKWESLVDEANALRKEIKAVAREYDVNWDEKVDEHDDRVAEALEEERAKRGGKGGKDKRRAKKRDDDDDDDD